MKLQNHSRQILTGPLTPNILIFALPIALSSMLQQLFNAADTAIVGLFTDSVALAAVGTNGEIIALLVSVSAGISIGANVLLARFLGEGSLHKISDALHTALAFALLFGILGAAIGPLFSRPLLTAIHTPQNVLDPATSYLRIYFIGYPFLMLYDFGSAILRSNGDSRRPFFALIASGVLNILLNLIFVVIFKWGVIGVAIATDLSTCFSSLLVLYWLWKEPGIYHFSIQKLTIDPNTIKEILAIGLPAAIQSSVFCIANIFIQASVNSFGEIAIAGSTIAMNFEYFGYYMITAFGQTATTFTSQNYAAENKKRCIQILKLCLLFSVIFSSLVTLPLTLGCQQFSRLFTSESAVIHAARERILLILAVEPVCSFYEIPAGFLRGMGYSTSPALITTIGTCALRILWIFTIFQKSHTLHTLFLSFPLSWLVTILFMWIALYRILRYHIML